ncbi:unnamed protein product [Urochloa humidicola]
MDAHAQLLLVLLVTWASWPISAGSLSHGASGLYPVLLLPGFACSQLDARLTGAFDPASAAPSCGGGVLKGKEEGWFRLWNNHTALQEDPALLPCYAELLRLVYDPVAGDYRNVPGVETRVVAFGTTRGFSYGDPAIKNFCMEKVVQALEGVGYREGENLFGAPYDFRYAPAPPGQANREFSRFLSSLTVLVEHASERNGNKPAILVTHSFGGIIANVFLRRSPLAWRRRYVKHFVMVSAGAGGGVPRLEFGVSSPPTDPVSFADTGRSFAGVFSTLPSPRVFGHAPLVVTRARNYSAYDIPEYLRAVGFSGDDMAPDQGYFKSVLIRNSSHGGVISDGFALDRLVDEILEANRAILGSVCTYCSEIHNVI